MQMELRWYGNSPKSMGSVLVGGIVSLRGTVELLAGRGFFGRLQRSGLNFDENLSVSNLAFPDLRPFTLAAAGPVF
jgi:hypothetical protein